MILLDVLCPWFISISASAIVVIITVSCIKYKINITPSLFCKFDTEKIKNGQSLPVGLTLSITNNGDITVTLVSVYGADFRYFPNSNAIIPPRNACKIDISLFTSDSLETPRRFFQNIGIVAEILVHGQYGYTTVYQKIDVNNI